MTANECEMCKKLKNEIQSACSQHMYDFSQHAIENAAPWLNDTVQKVMHDLYADSPAWVTLDQESNTIVFADDSGFDPEYLPLLPILFKEISPEGAYELKVGDQIIGKVTYKGCPDPIQDGHTVRVGVPADLQLYQKLEMVTIDIDVKDGAT